MSYGVDEMVDFGYVSLDGAVFYYGLAIWLILVLEA